tara:strand:+ start:31218 stop:31469 length:252 start_codon:yes stop_codon:yes gene_type:complete
MWTFVIFAAIFVLMGECDPLIFSSENLMKGKINHNSHIHCLPRLNVSAIPLRGRAMQCKKQVVLLLQEAKHLHTECIHNCVWS